MGNDALSNQAIAFASRLHETAAIACLQCDHIIEVVHVAGALSEPEGTLPIAKKQTT